MILYVNIICLYMNNQICNLLLHEHFLILGNMICLDMLHEYIYVIAIIPDVYVNYNDLCLNSTENYMCFLFRDSTQNQIRPKWTKPKTTTHSPLARPESGACLNAPVLRSPFVVNLSPKSFPKDRST